MKKIWKWRWITFILLSIIDIIGEIIVYFLFQDLIIFIGSTIAIQAIMPLLYKLIIVQKLKEIEEEDKKKSSSGFKALDINRKDNLDLDGISHCKSMLKRKNLTIQSRYRIFGELNSKFSNISLIKKLKKKSKESIKDLLEFLLNYLKNEDESSLEVVLNILTWICRSEMRSIVDTIFHDHLQSLFGDGNRTTNLLRVLFYIGHFKDITFWISKAMDEENIEFLDILTEDLHLPELVMNKNEIRKYLLEK
ncbi:hypothetical protein LCGC14_0814490 [marine sediment metagenome]|uniref:Uncharacterized protein n=1 Tax=marine sediment metagenome TaxID=412755 RepID=A0A0F9S5L8_9ZZZZ